MQIYRPVHLSGSLQTLDWAWKGNAFTYFYKNSFSIKARTIKITTTIFGTFGPLSRRVKVAGRGSGCVYSLVSQRQEAATVEQ